MRPGIADADAAGRCRLDAMARWLQDIAYGDLVDAGFEGRGAWIVRRTRIQVDAFPRFGEQLTISSYTSGDRKLVSTQDSGACAPAGVPGHSYTVSSWYRGTDDAEAA